MLVLNASYEPINVCTIRRAAVLVLKSRAEVLEERRGALHSERLALARPCVIRLMRYVRIPRDVHRRKITRKAVLARDAWTCQYCGREAAGLTVDHVIPRSRGGESVWENIVASCAPCNRKQGQPAAPREARMHPANRPRPPGPTVFIRVAAPADPAGLGAVPGGGRQPASDRRKARRPPTMGGLSKVRLSNGFRISGPGGTFRPPDAAGARGGTPPGGSHAARSDAPVTRRGERATASAAPHLQRPEITVTQLRTTSFLWSAD